MANNLNNLFIWNGDLNKKERMHDRDYNDYWEKRTEIAANEAVKRAINIPNKQNSTFLDDDVYAEAKQLVRGWVTEQKIYGKLSNRESFLRLPCEELDQIRQPNVVEVHKEWEHLVGKLERNENFKDEINQMLETDNGNSNKDQRLRTVMDNLHNKSFVKKSQLRLVDSPRKVDVGKRMDNRQEQVKKNREERLRNEEIRRTEKLAEKEARSEALKMLKEENLRKEINKKREEELIEMEMHKIRAEIQRQREEESKERERSRDSQRLSVRQPIHEVKDVQIKTDVDTNQRFKIISEIVDRKFLNKNKAMLRRSFQLWRDEVAKRRVAMAQANVWHNWQLLRRLFREWRRYSRLSVINRKIDLDHQRMKENQRKETMAVTFWKKTILKKCLIHWSLYVVDEKETRWFVKLEEMRKRKMTAYIETLQDKAKENQNKLNLLSSEKKEHEITEATETEKNISSQVQCKIALVNSPRVTSSSVKTTRSSARSTSRSKKAPTEAWQVTKKHVNLPLDQLIGDSNNFVQDSAHFKSLRPPKAVDNYANRNATQKELIEHQRSKLKEQDLLINELKSGNVLHKIKDEISRFKEPNNVSNQILLSNVEDNVVIEEKVSVNMELMPKKVNKFVAQMEERSKEREKIKNERLEKQKRNDEEKRKKLAEQIAEQCKLEAEEKLKRELLLKEKREKEKMREAAKKKQLEIEQEKNQRADQFHEMILMKRYGVGSWKRLLEIKRNNLISAEDHYKKSILKKAFVAWLGDVNQVKVQQNKIISVFYNKVLLTRCFYRLRLYKERFLFMEQLARRHYDETLTKKFFSSWRLSNHRSQIRLDKLEIQSEKLYKTHLLKHCFSIWKQLPVASRAERQRERRKEIMRQKVASIIPDFKSTYFDS